MSIRSGSSSESGFPSALPARWSWREIDPAIARRLTIDAGFPPLLARILAARGIAEHGEARHFLQPGLGQLHNPFELKGMTEATDRIGKAIDAGERIWIYGDYDVDGITATAILLLTLEELGAAADYYIPHRLNEGYGLNMEAVEYLAGEGAQLIVTVDCGITAVDEARRACELGIGLIVTDHHEPGPELPPCVAVINPKQDGCAYPFKGLSGAGVGFKLAHALLKRFHPDPERAREFLKSLLDLAALGTVADIVPMMGENRPIVIHGLALLRQCKRAGLMHLLDRAALAPSQLDAGSISYVIAPRINAAGRTEHAMFGLELLLTRDMTRARELARQLESFNQNRRDIEQGTLDEAVCLLEPLLNDPVIVVAQDAWHQGVLGIVASRILGQCYRPTIVIGIDGEVARGSGRSIPGFDLHEAIHQCREHVLQFGGHKMAIGLELRADKIDDFRAAINRYARTVLGQELMRPQIVIDAEANPEDLTRETVTRLGELAPHGPDNPRPIVSLEGWRLIEAPRVMRGRHLKLNLVGERGQSLTALGWGMVGRLDEFEQYQGGALRLAGTPTLNNWNGRVSVELELKDFQLAG